MEQIASNVNEKLMSQVMNTIGAFSVCGSHCRSTHDVCLPVGGGEEECHVHQLLISSLLCVCVCFPTQ